jgi:YbbR domain-containing protein
VFEGLDTSKYDAKAANVESTKVDVVVKGVKTLLDKIKTEDIQAIVDLKDLKEGTWEVPVTVKGSDNKLVYTSKTTKVKIVIKEK